MEIDPHENLASSDLKSKQGNKKLTSFSLGKRKPAPQQPAAAQSNEESKEILVAIGHDGMESLRGKVSSEKVIPKQENTWRAEKRIKSMYLPEQAGTVSHDERFVVETVDAGPEKNVQYGLTLMQRRQDNPQSEANVVSTAERDEKQQLQKDLRDLPEEANLDEYESMPIEDFGAAMLRGMGWEKGKAIGRNSQGPVEPVEYVPRIGRLGLGATPKPEPLKEQKFLKPGDTRNPKKDLVAAPRSDGKVRHVKPIGEKLVERVKAGVQLGKVMRVISGRHEGLKAIVLSVEDGSGERRDVVVKIMSSEEKVRVRSKELVDLGSLEEEEYMKKRDKKAEERSRDNGRGERKFRSSEVQRLKDNDRNARGSSEEKMRKKESSWLRNQIRVRIIDKRVGKGQLYLKKGTIVDVSSPSLCDVLVDDSQSLASLEQGMLETVLPKRGGRIAVLLGKFKGEVGKLLDRHIEDEVATVQLAGSFEIIRLHLGSVAEFVGDAMDGES